MPVPRNPLTRDVKEVNSNSQIHSLNYGPTLILYAAEYSANVLSLSHETMVISLSLSFVSE